MKKLFVFVSCFSVVFMLNNVSVAQSPDATGFARTQPLSAAHIAAQAQAVPHQALPFGYAPYPTVDGMPAYGIPYSFPRERRAIVRGQILQRPMFARLAPPPHQPMMLPTPGSAPGPQILPEHPPMVAPPLTFGQVPQMQGMVAATPVPAGPPVVVHRPTPFRNAKTLLFAPRPYLGYDPYAGFPPFPGYLPPH